MRPRRFADGPRRREGGSRGQSLLEALVALGITSLVLGAAYGALMTVARAKGLDERRAAAAAVAANAATELRAVCEYDPQAVAALAAATWTVLPPSPPPGAPQADGAPVTLSLRLAPQQGDARVAGLSFAAAGSSGTIPLVVQQYAPPPGAQLPAASP